MRKVDYELFHNKTVVQKNFIHDDNFTYRIILDFLNQHLPKKKLKILDIGSGAGTISLYLGRYRHNVLGIDISKKAIESAIVSAKNLNLDNVKFRIYQFPDQVPNEKFDVILCFEVLEHIREDRLALKKLNKLLMNNGLLFLSTPSKNAPLYRLRLANEFDMKVGHLRRYTVDELSTMLREAGFSIISIKKTEGIIRNFLFLNPIALRLLRFVKYYISDIVTYIDNISVRIFGESDILVVAKKR